MFGGVTACAAGFAKGATSARACWKNLLRNPTRSLVELAGNCTHDRTLTRPETLPRWRYRLLGCRHTHPLPTSTFT